MDINSYFEKFRYLTHFYQGVVGIAHDGNTIAVVEIVKKPRCISIVKKKLYDLSDSVYTRICQDFKLENKLIALNLDQSVASYKIIPRPDLLPSEISLWLKENSGEYLPLSLSADTLILSYKEITFADEKYLLLGFVNSDEIYNLLSHWPKTSIISGISPGFSDMALTDDTGKEQVYGSYIVHQGYHEFVLRKNHQLLFYNQIPASFQKENSAQGYIKSVNSLFGETMHQFDYTPAVDTFKIYTKDTLYTMHSEQTDSLEISFYPAYALAKNVLAIDTPNLNFLTESLKEKKDQFNWKQTLMKLILFGGMITISLYLLIFLPTLFVNFLNGRLLEEKDSLIPQLAQIEGLKTRQNSLENDLINAQRVSAFKSESSVLLKALAYHIPGECWLTGLSYIKESEERYNSVISGMGSSREVINRFLANLESDTNFSDVKLDFIDQIPKDEMYRVWKIRSGKYMEFKISLRF
jgi:Tfp pilus assembly protein PilN